MKKKLLLFVCLSCVIVGINAQGLSNYATVSITAGNDATVTPVSSPTNTIKMAVTASGNFSGVLTANSSTGKVVITDAKPAGTYLVTVKAFSVSGSSTTKSFTLNVNNPSCSDGKFSGNNNVLISRPNLTGIAVADFNGDGHQDLAAAHEGFNSVSIRLGDGSGGFIDSSEQGVTSHPYAVAIGDFDMDGNQDFAVTNEGSSLVAIRLGDGAGGFNIRPNVVVGASPMNIAIGDFNKDGKQDFATANFMGQSVSIRLGDGSGYFSGSTEVPVGSFPISVAIGDFNRDGKQDIAVTNSGLSTVSIRIGNGLGAFSGSTEVPVGFSPYSVCIGDFNMDGKQDLAIANYSSNTISIRIGNGLGSFSGSTEVAVGSGPYSVTIGNFNSDNYQDLATTNYFSNTVSVRLGDGTGLFSDSTEIPVGSYPVCVVVGEFNGDSLQDLAVANYNDHTISIRLGIDGLAPVVAVSSNSPVCAGQSIQINASGGNSYSWTGPNAYSSTSQNPVIPLAALNRSGTYTVSVINSSNCTAQASTTISMNPLPVVTFVLPIDTICTSDPVLQLNGGAPAGGIYTGTGVVSGNQFDPVIAGLGNYNVFYTYTDSNTCSSTDSSKMHVLICTGLEEENVTSIINVYPNPVQEDFIMDLSSVTGQTACTLYAHDGRLVREWIVAGNGAYTFSTKGLANGLYFLRLMADDRLALTRIVKVE